MINKSYVLVAAAVVATVFCITPWGRSVDFVVYDTFFKVRGNKALTDEIVFVTIDEASFQATGEQWPWPRSLHARALENIFRGGAKVVAFDVLFPEASDPDEDAAFTDALSKYGTTVLATDISSGNDNRFAIETVVEPLADFQAENVRLAHIRTPSDSDGFVRRVDLEMRGFRSLGYETAVALTDGACCPDIPAEALPLLNYSGDTRSIITISFYQALDPDTYLPPDTFRDKAVVIGVSTMSNAMADERRPDHFPTPFSRWGGNYAPGSLVHANVIANLLQNSFISALPTALVAGIGLLIAIGFGLAARQLSLGSSTAIAVVTAALLLVLCYGLFSAQQTYVAPTPLLLPLFAAYLASPYYRYLEEKRQRDFIREAFSSYVNPEIVRQLEENPDNVKLGGKQIEGTVLFLDIAGFTDMSERHDPETVVTFINEFLSALIDIAMDHGGTVERFLGDAIMVIWGAPTDQSDHAQLACKAAQQMVAEIDRISAAESERMGAQVHARIGVNTGSMTAGNIGGDRRFNYTVLGDSVNLAARLEGLNKVYGTTAIIGAATAELVADNINLRPLDRVTVKGRQQPEQIFELLDPVVSDTSSDLLQNYANGLEQYQAGNWEKAIEAFESCLTEKPKDGPSKALLARCREFQRSGTPDGWSGVFDITSK